MRSATIDGPYYPPLDVIPEEAVQTPSYSKTYHRRFVPQLTFINEIPSDKEKDLFRGQNWKHAGPDLSKFTPRKKPKAPVRVDQAQGEREPPVPRREIGRLRMALKNRRIHVFNEPEI